MTFESRPCQFTELPFLISVTAGKTRQIIDGGDQGEGGRGPGSQREGEVDQPGRPGYFEEACPLLCDEGYFWESVFLR